MRLNLVDRTRTVAAAHTLSGKPGPRVLVTDVWYPADGWPAGAPRPGAGAATAFAPYPLIVFAPGFDVGPSTYSPLLISWARAGYVVASPSFPLTKPAAIGGLNENDVANQPGDLSFLITQMLQRSKRNRGRLAGLVDPKEIAVAGHSDGADTAFVAADGRCCRDRRIEAVIVMSGAALPFFGRYYTSSGPPLFVMQGSADASNPPSFGLSLYRQSPAPKFLLWMPGADHEGPFVGTSRLEALVAVMSLEFLDRYLGRSPGKTIRLPAGASQMASLQSLPR